MNYEEGRRQWAKVQGLLVFSNRTIRMVDCRTLFNSNKAYVIGTQT